VSPAIYYRDMALLTGAVHAIELSWQGGFAGPSNYKKLQKSRT